MNAPLLSICIPTYKRAHCLKDCLNSIVSQFEDADAYAKVEVIISDNASDDNTEDVVREFQAKYPNIKYYKNENNIGFDRNFLSVIEKSSGEFCLPIGDDDAFFPGSFSVLIHKIQTLKFPYYLLNGWGYDHELANPVVSHPNRKMQEDISYGSLSEFVRSIPDYMDLVGNFGGMSHLFARKAWMEFAGKEKFVGCQVNHLFAFLTIFKDSPCAILAEPVIKTRNDNMRWDSFPGLENSMARAKLTAKTVFWISDLYDLNIPHYKVRSYFFIRAYWISLKEFAKRVLSSIGLRK
ncbi:MAG: glycosyl transferase family 2 [Candidatus Taylorbacteria bacterium]|nr:glycosyl transferase family 2 [Candidatus Taylorbacteria bacterium]